MKNRYAKMSVLNALNHRLQILKRGRSANDTDRWNLNLYSAEKMCVSDPIRVQEFDEAS